MKKNTFILSALLLCLLLAASALTGCASKNSGTVQSAASSQEADVNSEAPADEEVRSTGGALSNFTAQDLDGNTITESVLEGKKVTMLNVWATYCGPCIREMPELGELAEEYAEDGVQIIGLPVDILNSDGSVNAQLLSDAQDIIETTGANYLHLVPSEDLYELINSAYAVPTTFFFDENGNQLGKSYVGAKDKEEWAAILEDLLDEADD